MTPRERFLSTLLFGEVDRPVRTESLGFWKETLERWHGEGLPEEITDEIGAFIYFGFDFQIPFYVGAHEHPGFDPVFEEEVISADERFVTKRDHSGSVVKVLSNGTSTIPLVCETPVRCIEDFNRLKERLDPETEGRLAPLKLFLDIEGSNDWPLCVYICGVFGTLRHLLGLSGLSIALRTDKELIKSITAHWLRFWRRVIERVSEKRIPELVSLWEDMCYLNGPMIGPKAFREFMLPCYAEFISFCKNHIGIPGIGVDSDGDVNLLIPLFVEAGVNMLWPFEVQAGMDVLEVRKKWPREFVIWGGIDKRTLAGQKGDIERETRRVVESMLQTGGYIPAIDHAVPPDVPMENWVFFLNLVRHLGEELCR